MCYSSDNLSLNNYIFFPSFLFSGKKKKKETLILFITYHTQLLNFMQGLLHFLILQVLQHFNNCRHFSAHQY